MRSPFFLTHRRPLPEGRGIPDARTLFGIGRMPCNNHVRQMPDGVPSEHSDGVFSAIVAAPRVRGAVGHARADGVGRLGAFPVPQAALRSVFDAPCGR